MSKNLLIAAGLACIFLAGCGSSDDSAKGGDGTTASLDGSAATGWNGTDACAVIDEAEMGEVMKSEVTEASLALVHQPDGPTAGTSECSYIFADGGRASVTTRWSPINDNTPETMAMTRSTLAQTMSAFTDKKLEDVPGVGKSAFFVPGINQFNVFLDDARMMIINLPSAPAAEAKDRSIALVAKAS